MGRDLPARLATLVLAGVAYVACEVAASPDGRPKLFGIVFGGLLLTLAALLAIFVRRPTGPKARLPWRFTLLLVAGFALPLVAEPLLRRFTDQGFPLELQVVNALRSLAVLLAGLGAWAKFRRLAAVATLFLALFAAAMGDQPAVPYWLAGFAVCGGVWLICEHRATGQELVSARGELVRRVRLRLPIWEGVVFGVLAALAVGVAVAGPKRVMLTLWELVPTSGGTGNADPFARGGVGDGPDEVAGDNAKSAGMVETDKTIEDNKNALVDVVNDMYGPPHKPRKDQEKMVAGGVADVIQSHGKTPDSRRPSRDFDTSRAGPKGDRKPGDGHAARGRIEVEGRTPLHIRVVTYTRYDTTEARWMQGDKPGARRIEADDAGDQWMRVNGMPPGGWYATNDRHKLKVADLKSALVPSPANLARFRIQRVDKAEYYEWEYDGVLALAGRQKTPPGVVVSSDCRTLDPTRLPPEAFPIVGYDTLLEVPDELKTSLTATAQEWAGHLPRGWPQVNAILTTLRTDFTLDRRASAPPGISHPVGWFLTESKRGPDYLFASSAALLLRSLGYPSRVCLGYYAHPDKYDPATQHTPVSDDDLHLWPEVLLSDGQWIVVEPTPDYAVLPPLKPWQEQLADAAQALGGWVVRNWLPLAVAVAALALLITFRRRAWDAALTAGWRLFPGRTWRAQTLRTVRLLERRAALAGRGRAAGETLSEWMTRQQNGDTALSQLTTLAEWAAYSPVPPVQEADVPAACQHAVRIWNYPRFSRGTA